MNEAALETLRHRDVFQAAEVYPFALPSLQHNEAHRAIRRAMERSGEVHAIPGGFVWRDDTWFADASVSVVTDGGNTAVTALVDRRREAIACSFGVLAASVLGGFLLLPALGAAALAAPVVGMVGGFALDRWTRARWRQRAWSAVEAVDVILSNHD